MRTAQFAFLLSLMMGLLAAGCGNKGNGTAGATNTNSSASSSSPLTAPVDYLGAVGKAQQSAIKTIDLASVNQAINMYKIEEGKNPPSLEALVTEKYLPRLPELPSGLKYAYDPNTGIVKAIKK